MAQKRATTTVAAAEVAIYGLGGDVRPRTSWGSDDPETREGTEGPVAVHAVTGAGVSIGGIGQDGATLLIGTPLETMEVGTIYRAEGRVEVTHKAQAKVLDIPGEPVKAIPSLLTEIWVERVVPVGSVEDLMRKGGGAAPAGAGAQAKGGDAK